MYRFGASRTCILLSKHESNDEKQNRKVGLNLSSSLVFMFCVFMRLALSERPRQKIYTEHDPRQYPLLTDDVAVAPCVVCILSFEMNGTRAHSTDEPTRLPPIRRNQIVGEWILCECVLLTEHTVHTKTHKCELKLYAISYTMLVYVFETIDSTYTQNKFFKRKVASRRLPNTPCCSIHQ